MANQGFPLNDRLYLFFILFQPWHLEFNHVGHVCFYMMYLIYLFIYLFIDNAYIALFKMILHIIFPKRFTIILKFTNT